MAELNRNILLELYRNDNIQELTAMEISWKEIKKIDSSAFNGLSQLETLSLEKNKIKKIEVNSFESLENLNRLILSNNKLKRIVQNTFNGLSKLKHLFLESNEIKHIEVRSFECLSNLEELNLFNNKLKRIDRNTFNGLSKLVTLSLKNNTIEKINVGSFDSLSNLKVLELNNKLLEMNWSYNKLKNIYSNTFQRQTKLEILSLERNEIEEIEVKSFENLSNLKELNLFNNNLKRIDSNTFKGLTSLEKLSLYSNNLEEIKVENLTNLKELSLNNNKINKIDQNTFVGLENLETLTLDNNIIEEIKMRSFESLSNLKELELNNNKLKRIDSNTFKGLKNLETLSFNSNIIEDIDVGSFEGLSSLKWLNLSLNKLKRIDSNTFKGLIKLEIIFLDRNEIEEIEVESFECVSKLKILWLNNNKIKLIKRKCFESLKSIKNIMLYENYDLKALSFSIIYGNGDDDEVYFQYFILEKNGYFSDWKLFLEQFEEPINQFHNPKLLIVDYYDSLIRDIDIYTEELLEKQNENDLLQEKPKGMDLLYGKDTLKNPYKIEYKNESMINFNSGSTKIIDYLNLVRSKAIEAINKVKEENLERYELNKEKYKYDRNNLTVETFQEMKKELFKEKFCFLLKIDIYINEKNLFKLHTIVTDFYLDPFDKIILENYFNILLKDSSSFNLDNLCLILMSNCIYELCKSDGNEVISIKKESLKKIEHLKVDSRNEYFKIADCNFKLSHGFKDLSQIKSIDIVYYLDDDCEYKIDNLKSLTNLEYVSISGCKITKEMFIGLDKLIGLRLDNCYVLDNYSFKIFKIYPGFFNEMNCLKSLDLSYINIQYIDPEVFIQTPMLTHLRIFGINCKLDENTFSHLKHLKTIELDKSKLNFIDSNALEVLRRSNIEIIMH